jgi:hypothetical protein
VIDNTSINTIIALVGLVIAIIFNALAVFRYIAGLRDLLNDRIFTEAEKSNARSEAIAREVRLMIENLAEREAKARQDFAATTSAAILEVRRDSKAIEDKFHTLQRETITRGDLDPLRNEITQLRQEVMAAMDRQERNRNEALDKLEKRVETMVRGRDRDRDRSELR